MFSNGVRTKIYSSLDGATWIDSTPSIGSYMDASIGRKISLFYSESLGQFDACYAQEASTDYIAYRRGTPDSGGTITWAGLQFAIPPFQTDAGDNGITQGATRWSLYRKLISGNIYYLDVDWSYRAEDYTTEINIGDVGAGCKTPFTPYATVNADGFGYATIGFVGVPPGANYKRATRFQATRTESITTIKARCYSASGTTNVRAAIYSDSAGAPSSLLGQSDAVAVTTSEGWYEFTFSTPISVTDGTYYWLALIWDNANFRYREDPTSGSSAENADTYSDGFSDPFGSYTSYTTRLSIFAYSTSLPTTIQMKGWQLGDQADSQLRQLWCLDGRFKVKLRVKNPTAVIHAGNLYARLWVSSNSDMSGATALTGWGYVAVSFSGVANEVLDKTINLDVNLGVGDAFAVSGKYFLLEVLWDVTTAATDGRVQIEAGTLANSYVSPPDHVLYYPVVAIDSAGYPWIGFGRHNGVRRCPYIAKGDANDGTWTFPLSTVRKLTNTTSLEWVVTPIPLSNGKIYVLYARRVVAVVLLYAYIYGQLWDGSAWGSEEDLNSLLGFVMAQWDYYSAVADTNDDVHLFALEDTSLDIEHFKRTYSTSTWSQAVTPIQAATTSTSAPVASLQSTGVFKVFWAGSPIAEHIYYKTVTGMTADTDPTDWINETPPAGQDLTDNNLLTCFYQAYGSNIGLVYMTVTSSPYNVRYAFLSLAVAVAPQMIGDGLTWTVQ